MGVSDREGNKLGKSFKAEHTAPAASASSSADIEDVRAPSGAGATGAKRTNEAAKLADFLGAPAKKQKQML